MNGKSHTRMPLIINKLDEEAWLTSSNPMHVASLLKPYQAESMDEVTSESHLLRLYDYLTQKIKSLMIHMLIYLCLL